MIRDGTKSETLDGEVSKLNYDIRKNSNSSSNICNQYLIMYELLTFAETTSSLPIKERSSTTFALTRLLRFMVDV